MPDGMFQQYWKHKEKFKTGRKYSPTELWDSAVEYFEFASNSPLQDSKLYIVEGKLTNGDTPKQRIFTVQGLCAFLDISTTCYYGYKKDAKYVEVIDRIENIIQTQELELAAANMANSTIVSRNLGQVDNTRITLSDAEETQTALSVLKQRLGNMRKSAEAAEKAEEEKETN